MQQLFFSFLAACAGGYIGLKTRFPSGIMLGATLGVVAYRYFADKPLQLPPHINFMAQVLFGMVIAAACDAEFARKVYSLMWPMIISCLMLIMAGICISYVFYRLGYIDFPTAYMAGSPGAMNVLVAISQDVKADVALVSAFHFVRLLIISVTAPLIFHFLIKN